MKNFILGIIFVFILYIILITMVSLVVAIFALRKGIRAAIAKFKDFFLNFLVELLNPFNWF